MHCRWCFLYVPDDKSFQTLTICFLAPCDSTFADLRREAYSQIEALFEADRYEREIAPWQLYEVVLLPVLGDVG